MWGRQVEAMRGKNTLIFESLFQQVSCKGIKVRNLNLPEDVHGLHCVNLGGFNCPSQKWFNILYLDEERQCAFRAT